MSEYRVIGGSGRTVATFGTGLQAFEYAGLHPSYSVITPCGCAFRENRPGIDCGCGWGDLCPGNGAFTTVNGETYSYRTGRALATYDARQYSQCAAGARHAREHAAAWKAAAGDHAETSYFGAAHVRAMRAFWLGVARAIRG